MSEPNNPPEPTTPEPDSKTPTQTQTETKIDDLVIRLEGGEEYDISEHPAFKAQQEAFQAMQSQVEELSKKTTKAEKKAEEAEKKVLLDRLEQAGYNTEIFKKQSLDALQLTVEGLSQKDGRIVIPKKDKPKTPKSEFETILIKDVKTGKFVPWDTYKYGDPEQKP